MSRKPWWKTLDPEEFATLRRRVQKVIYDRFGPSLGPEVEDVVHEGFVALFRHREEVPAEADGRFKYVRRVAVNAALDRLRKRKRRRKLLPDSPPPPAADEAGNVDEEAPPPLPDHLFPHPEPRSQAQEAELREIYQKIREDFRALGDLERLITWSYCVDGRSIRSIASEVGLNWHKVADIVDAWIERVRGRYFS